MFLKCAVCCLVSVIALLGGRVQAAEATPQDMQVIGRALSFKDGAKSGTMSVAVLYDSSNQRSSSEMQAALEALKKTLAAGSLKLRAVPVEQSKFTSASGYDAVLTMSGVNQQKLGQALAGQGVPCVTLDITQVKGGACTVAVRTMPSVSISFNSRNAAAANVRFATAFVMMVREI